MADPIRIVEVEPGSPEEKEFISLPFTIYRHNSRYVPWFKKQMKNILARRHPYFEHSDGEFFIALRNKETVGRIALLEPRRYNDYHRCRDGRFYFFDAKDDLEASRALFRHAEEWARARNLTRLIGPQGFSSFSGAGILIDGFEHTASMTMMPYHFPYYRELMESCGFVKHKDFYSAKIDARSQTLPVKYQRIAEITLKRGRFTVPSLQSKKELKKLAAEVGHIYNSSWGEHDDFTPLTEGELEQIREELLHVSEPSLVKVIRSGREVAGFVLAFPDLSRVMQKSRGRLNPYILYRMLKEKKKAEHFIINGLGILPEHRRTGGIAVLFNEITKSLREHGVKTAELTQIAETTDLMMSNIGKLNAKIYKTHRVYQKPVG
ncbi:MAG: hypothetical protein ACLFNZ_06055 [Spirochaetaceae bacterium]